MVSISLHLYRSATGRSDSPGSALAWLFWNSKVALVLNLVLVLQSKALQSRTLKSLPILSGGAMLCSRPVWMLWTLAWLFVRQICWRNVGSFWTGMRLCRKLVERKSSQVRIESNFCPMSIRLFLCSEELDRVETVWTLNSSSCCLSRMSGTSRNRFNVPQFIVPYLVVYGCTDADASWVNVERVVGRLECFFSNVEGGSAVLWSLKKISPSEIFLQSKETTNLKTGTNRFPTHTLQFCLRCLLTFSAV